MAATQFALVTEWKLEAPIMRVWAELSLPEAWPDWWRAVKKVEKVRDGNAAGIGAVRRFTWGTALPYTITFDMTATRIEPSHILEGQARGELDGVGRWTLSESDGVTIARYDWVVEITKPWQRALAPVLRPVFAWNHNVVMSWGEAGLRQRLGLGR